MSATASGDDSEPAEAAVEQASGESPGINWGGVFWQSFDFLLIEHGFRYLTEEGTRFTHQPFFQGYVRSLNNLHGWSDGDPFYVNYVGHPMQGAVTGFIFVQNDSRYRDATFGKNRRYWKSRLRAAAFSWAYSEQFEIGPLSEASLGHVQSSYPQQGFVDQVVTPAIGLGWMLAEDSVDQYFIKRIEARFRNPYVRLLVRSGLNPSRSMANVLAGNLPWHRQDRGGVYSYEPRPGVEASSTAAPESQNAGISNVDFLAQPFLQAFAGPGARGACIGGGASAAFRITPAVQLVGQVAGCKLTDFGPNFSGDSLTYMLGPRWTPRSGKKWEPYVQVLAGGRTTTHQLIDPVKKAQVEASLAQQGKSLSFSDHPLYSTESEITGFAVSAGVGLDVNLTSALAFRVADLSYVHSWHSRLDGIDYGGALQYTSGLILRWGTW